MVGDLANTEVKRGSGEVLMRTKMGSCGPQSFSALTEQSLQTAPSTSQNQAGPERQGQVKWAQDKREPATPEQTLKKQPSVTGWSLIKTACSSAGILKERGFIYLVQLER